jgi:hypothetical protein
VLAVAVALGAYLVDLGAAPHASPAAGSSTASSAPAARKPAPSTPASKSPASKSPASGTPASRKALSGGSTSAKPPSRTTRTAAAVSGVRPSQAVKVLVANASQTNGIAAYYAGKLASAGWGTLTPVTASTAVSTSSVHYAAGQEKAARAVAAALGIPASAVQAIGPTAPVPVPGATGADVVVLAGDDLAAKVPAGSG